jgi:hypothetical protein
LQHLPGKLLEIVDDDVGLVSGEFVWSADAGDDGDGTDVVGLRLG